MALPLEAPHFLVVIGASVLFLHFMSVSTHLWPININTHCVITLVIMFTVNIDSFFTISTFPKLLDRLCNHPPSYSSDVGALALGVKRPGRVADHPTSSSHSLRHVNSCNQIIRHPSSTPYRRVQVERHIGSLRSAVRMRTGSIELRNKCSLTPHVSWKRAHGRGEQRSTYLFSFKNITSHFQTCHVCDAHASLL